MPIHNHCQQDKVASQAIVEPILQEETAGNQELACFDCPEGICARHKGNYGISPEILEGERIWAKEQAEAEAYLTAEGYRIIGQDPGPSLF